MSSTLIWGIGVVYLVVAVDQFAKGNNGMGIAWLGYSLGNLGLGMASQ